MTEPASLRLVALDAKDLQVVSAQVQDAVMRIADMAYRPNSQRFALIINRFNWQTATNDGGKKGATYERRRAALNFDRIRAVTVQNIPQRDSDAVLELLAIEFDEIDAPGGKITLIFAGGGSIRLDAECIEVQLEDLGAAWSTSRKPEHILDDLDSGSDGEASS